MKKLTVNQIRDAYHALYMAFDSCMTNHAEKLLAMCIAEEKGHRGFMDGFTACHTRDTIGTRDAGKLFAVLRVAEYLLIKTGAKAGCFPNGQDYLHTQTSCFYAAGMADEFSDKIIAAWEGKFDVFTLADLDYRDFVKVKPAHEMPATI